MDDEVRPEGGYTPKQRRVHWIVAGLVVLQLFLGVIIGSTQPSQHIQIMWLHAAVGSTIFVLMLSRWRLRQRVGAPKPPPGTPVDAAALARANHLGYYALLLGIPVIGWCAYLFDSGFGSLHAAGAGILVLAIVAHLCGVYYHRFIREDSLLSRMLPGQRASEPATRTTTSG